MTGLSAAVIAELVRAGLSGDALIASCERIEAADAANQPVVDTRSPAAIRQARYRAHGGGKIPEELRIAVFDRDGWACLECEAESNLCCDHIHPVSKGGPTTFENLQTLCIPCNSRKKDRIRKSLVRGNSVEIPGNPPSPPIPPLEDNTQNPPLTPPSCQMLAKRERAGKWHRLPDDWQPGPLPDKLAAKAAQWPPGVIDDHEANFRGWAANAPDTNGKGRKLNWDMAWHNWLRDKQNYGTSNRAGSIASPRKTGSGGKRTVADFLADGGFH